MPPMFIYQQVIAIYICSCMFKSHHVNMDDNEMKDFRTVFHTHWHQY